MNIINEKDDAISAKANSMWREMIMHSNDGNYSEFIKHFSPSLMLGLNEVEVGRQFSTSELTRSLSDDFDELGLAVHPFGSLFRPLRAFLMINEKAREHKQPRHPENHEDDMASF